MYRLLARKGNRVRRNHIYAIYAHEISDRNETIKYANVYGCCRLLPAAVPFRRLAMVHLHHRLKRRCRDQIPRCARSDCGFFFYGRQPVLSTTRVFTFSRLSNASAFRIEIPSASPRPVPTMIAIGVASSNAHWQAVIRTAKAFTTAWAQRGWEPRMARAAKVMTDTARTAGTK
jgi:hypothetical protein